jgi:hypothetical protein
MDSTQQPNLDAVIPLSTPVVVVLGRDEEARTSWVEDPGLLLRMWALLKTLNEELHQVGVPPEAWPRFQRLLECVHAELERSVSGALADELRRLTTPSRAQMGAGELRVECASLLGWADGITLAMLGEVEAARQQEPRHPAKVPSHPPTISSNSG